MMSYIEAFSAYHRCLLPTLSVVITNQVHGTVVFLRYRLSTGNHQLNQRIELQYLIAHMQAE